MPALIQQIDGHRMKTHYNLHKYANHQGGYIYGGPYFGGYTHGGPYTGGYIYGGPFINNAPRYGNGVFSNIGKLFKPKSGVDKAVNSITNVVKDMSITNKNLLAKGIKAATSAMDLGTSIGDAMKAKRTANAIKNQHELEKQRMNIKDKLDDDIFNKVRGEGINGRKKKL